MALATDILQGKPAPPAVITKHELVTRSNVDRLYPNDALSLPADAGAPV